MKQENSEWRGAACLSLHATFIYFLSEKTFVECPANVQLHVWHGGRGGGVGGMARPLSKKLGESPGGWNEETESHG